MAFFPRPARPTAAGGDLRAFLARRERHSWRAAVASILIPAVILYAFYLDGITNIMPDEPVIIYAESWPLTRTDEEIIERQREFALEENERRAIRRRQFQRLAEQLGVEYDREEAAQQEAITRENRERLGRSGDDSPAPVRAPEAAAPADRP
ncbi:MAG: hypothetical protein H7X93_04060 [Sphingomonadaceae bacterium]|nr:hypothetical protein [Sphingomonadaceae bacterium]